MKIDCICGYSDVILKKEIKNKYKIEWICPKCKFIWDVVYLSNSDEFFISLIGKERQEKELNMGKLENDNSTKGII